MSGIVRNDGCINSITEFEVVGQRGHGNEEDMIWSTMIQTLEAIKDANRMRCWLTFGTDTLNEWWWWYWISESGMGYWISKSGMRYWISESGMRYWISESGMGYWISENGMRYWISESGMGYWMSGNWMWYWMS